MIMRMAAELGPWIWMVLGFLLLILEILAPGFFLLWIGLAAIATGTVSLALWGAAIWPWQVQVLVFLALSLAFVFAGKKVMAARGDDSDQPLLNQREKQLVGRTAILTEPIAEGHGRIKLGDTQWRVKGPDLPSGARVKVTGVEDSVLLVEPA